MLWVVGLQLITYVHILVVDVPIITKVEVEYIKLLNLVARSPLPLPLSPLLLPVILKHIHQPRSRRLKVWFMEAG